MFLWRWFRAVLSTVSGWVGAKTDKIYENKHAMGQVYDNAIDKGKARVKTVTDAVAELMGVEKTLVADCTKLGDQMNQLTKIKNGAQTAMQRRLDALKAQGKDKEQILADGEFIRHKKAFEDASTDLADAKKRFDEKDADRQAKRRAIDTYKAELQSMERANQKLKDEKQSAVADVAIAQQADAINNALRGISDDTADAELEKARKARDRVVNRAEIGTELAGNRASAAGSEYLDLANAAAANTELDGLLNWGDEKKADEAPLAPAKLPDAQ